MEVSSQHHSLFSFLQVKKHQVSGGYESRAGFEAAKNKTQLAVIQPVVGAQCND